MTQKRTSVEELQLLSPEDVAKLLRVSVNTLKVWRGQKRGPRYQVMGGRTIRYRPEDVQQWQMESLVAVDPLRL